MLVTKRSTVKVEWVNPEAHPGLLCRIGVDQIYREEDGSIRIQTRSTPDRAYRLAVEEAIKTLGRTHREPVDLILDFEGDGPKKQGEALKMCRSLIQMGHIRQIVVIRKSWMPAALLMGAVALIRTAGMPVSVRDGE